MVVAAGFLEQRVHFALEALEVRSGDIAFAEFAQLRSQGSQSSWFARGVLASNSRVWNTDIFGILPLAIGGGAGSGARQAVGVTILGGMLAATVIGLFIIPTLFAVIQRLGEWRFQSSAGAQPEAKG